MMEFDISPKSIGIELSPALGPASTLRRLQRRLPAPQGKQENTVIVLLQDTVMMAMEIFYCTLILTAYEWLDGGTGYSMSSWNVRELSTHRPQHVLVLLCEGQPIVLPYSPRTGVISSIVLSLVLSYVTSPPSSCNVYHTVCTPSRWDFRSLLGHLCALCVLAMFWRYLRHSGSLSVTARCHGARQPFTLS